MHFNQGVVLFLAALAAGAINSVAGGGSFLTFPSLLLVGIPPVNANATSTVALWPGQPASVWAYRHEIRDIPRRTFVPLTITGILGGIAGAYVLLITPQSTFMNLVPWLLLIATLIFTVSGQVTPLGWSAPTPASCGTHVGLRDCSAAGACVLPWIFWSRRRYSSSRDASVAGDGQHFTP